MMDCKLPNKDLEFLQLQKKTRIGSVWMSVKQKVWIGHFKLKVWGFLWTKLSITNLSKWSSEVWMAIHLDSWFIKNYFTARLFRMRKKFTTMCKLEGMNKTWPVFVCVLKSKKTYRKLKFYVWGSQLFDR